VCTLSLECPHAKGIVLGVLGMYEAVTGATGLVLVGMALVVTLEVEDDAAVVIRFRRKLAGSWYLAQVG
jgi:hypothetical protein